MTRPSMLSLTRMLAMRFVRLTVIPSLTPDVEPSNTHPTLSSSRFITIAMVPFSNSKSSLASALRNPYILTTPSLTCNTVPTSSNPALSLIPLSFFKSTEDTSLGLILSDIIVFINIQVWQVHQTRPLSTDYHLLKL